MEKKTSVLIILYTFIIIFINSCADSGNYLVYNSEADIPSIQKKYSTRLSKLKIGMHLKDFRKIFPEAYVGGQNDRITAYELTDVVKYVTETDIYRQNMIYGFGTPSPRIDKRYLWFYFYNNKLVQWGRPQDWPSSKQITNAQQISDPETEKDKVVTGTGFCISPDGYLLTAYHVIYKAKKIKAKFVQGEWIEAKLIKHSLSNDIAILKVDKTNLKYLSFTNPNTIHQGQRVFTFGYPMPELLGSEPKYTEGSISSLSGLWGEDSWMQISVPIQPGNSGGALMNTKGEIVGMTNWAADVATFYNKTGTLPQNVNWAIKSNYILPLIPQKCENLPIINHNDLQDSISHVKNAICSIEAYGTNSFLIEEKNEPQIEKDETQKILEKDNKMKNNIELYGTKFYYHTDTTEVYVIQLNWKNQVVAGFGPVIGQLKPIEEYYLITGFNDSFKEWFKEGKLVPMDVDS